MEYCVFMTLPLCTPGFHFGMIDITLRASLSNIQSKCFSNFMSLIEPSSFIVNCTMLLICGPL